MTTYLSRLNPIFTTIIQYATNLGLDVKTLDRILKGVDIIKKYLEVSDIDGFIHMANVLMHGYYSKNILGLVNFSLMMSDLEVSEIDIKIIYSAYSIATQYAKQLKIVNIVKYGGST